MTSTKTQWRIAGEEAVTCNCAWGCPCQFNAPPTTGCCQALAVHEVRQGNFGTVSLGGVRFAQIVSWPGRLDEGDGTRLVVIDEKASREQRDAIAALFTGKQGGAYFEIFAAICPHTAPPVFKPIEFTTDRQSRKATLRIAGLGEFATDAIKSPVDGSEHRARIVLPNGFEYKEAEMGNTLRMSATGGGVLEFAYSNTYAQLNVFDWTNG
jgi:hypothetical protein